MLRKINLLVLTALVFSCAGGATFADIVQDPIIYGNFSGTQVDFGGVQETATTDYLPLFGDPFHQAGWDQLLFFPTRFSSHSENGSADTTSGKLQMTLTAKDNFKIDRIVIEEYGSYAMTGGGGADTQANVNGDLTVTSLNTGDVTRDFFSLEFSLQSHTSGPFDARWEIDLTDLPFPVTMARVTFENILQTSSEPGTTAYIQKSVTGGPAIGLSVNSDPVPIPGALWLFTSGLGIFGFRRMKKWFGK